MKINNSSKFISNDILEVIQNNYDFHFPEDYKVFLLKNNGGVPTFQYFSTSDGKIDEIIDRFYSISDDDDNLISEIEGITKAGMLPSDLIPIASTLGGDDRVVLAIKGENFGKVFHWAWSEEDYDHKPSYKYVRPVADTFDSFLTMLKKNRE